MAAWLCFRFSDARHADKTRTTRTYAEALLAAMHNLNLSELIWVIALQIYALVKQDSLDWVHFGCTLYVAGLITCQIIFTAVATPRYICESPIIGLGILSLAVLGILTWLTFAAKFHRTYDALPQCYDQDQPNNFAELMKIGIAIFCVLVIALIAAMVFNWDEPPKPATRSTKFQRLSSWPLPWILVSLFVPFALLVVLVIFLLNDINVVRPWMDQAEWSMDLSQVLILVTVCGTVATSAYNAADMDCKSMETLVPHSLIDSRRWLANLN